MQDLDKRQMRRDKKFCSATCRKRYSRWIANIHKSKNDAEKYIDRLGHYTDYELPCEMAVQSLVLLRNRIDEILKSVKSERLR